MKRIIYCFSALEMVFRALSPLRGVFRKIPLIGGRRSYSLLGLVTIALAGFGQEAAPESLERLLLRPADVGIARSQANVSLKPHEIRKGRVILAIDILPQPPRTADRQAKMAASTGDANTFTLSFFTDVTYEITVNSVVHHPDGTRIINGSLSDHGIETVLLTIGPDGFLITLQDLNQALLYRASGNSQSASGEVTEIDLTKIPPVIR